MDQPPQANELDRLLDELEQMAAERGPAGAFYQRLLSRLCLVLNGSVAAFLLRGQNNTWQVLASVGKPAAGSLESLTGATSGDQLSGTPSLWGREREWLALPVRRANWDKGALWIEFRSSPSVAQSVDMVELAAAFSEILATRQLSDQESFLDQTWGGLQQLMGRVTGAWQIEEAGIELVNGLVPIVEADRVSLLRATGNTGRSLVTVSGVSGVDPRSPVLASLNRVAKGVFQSGKPVLHRSEPDDTPENSRTDRGGSPEGELLGNWLAVPLFPAERLRAGGVPANGSRGLGRPAVPPAVLVLEWSSAESFLQAAPRMVHVVPAVSNGWLLYSKWAALPRWVRGVFGGGRGAVGRGVGWLAPRVVMLAVVMGLVWLTCRPVDLTIEAKGTLQPVEQRGVFVGLDGFVAELLVQDGAAVEAGQTLARLRSPELDQQIEELNGELDLLEEQKRGLDIEINQLSADQADFAKIQNRLSSEYRLLETRLAGLHRKKEFFAGQQERLLVKAPVRGTLVGNQLQRYLDGRPVRRGDSLFRIVDFSGPWRIELQVADSDSGWVRRYYGENNAAGGQPPQEDRIDFVLASRPAEWRAARLDWISPVARNPDGLGTFVEVHCVPESAVSEDGGQMGATVLGSFHCGRQPFWFVWSRGLVESVQRRFWFRGFQ